MVKQKERFALRVREVGIKISIIQIAQRIHLVIIEVCHLIQILLIDIPQELPVLRFNGEHLHSFRPLKTRSIELSIPYAGSDNNKKPLLSTEQK